MNYFYVLFLGRIGHFLLHVFKNKRESKLTINYNFIIGSCILKSVI